MSVREYVGARYVPIIMGEWDKTRTYEPLMVVTHQGNSYTSRQYVPTGIDIANESYWVLSANYNAQVEAYRKEVKSFDGRITANANAIETEMERAQSAERVLQTNIDTEKTRAESAEQKIAAKTETFVTPEMYGAVGDGEADDYAALKKAFESGLTVILRPNITYAFSSIINLNDMNSLSVIGNNSTLKYIGSETQKTSMDAIINISASRNVNLEGVIFDGSCEWVERPLYENSGTQWDRYMASRTRALGGLTLNNVINYKLVKCGFTMSLHGVLISNCTNGTIISCFSSKTLADVVAVRDATNYLYVYGFNAYFPQDDAFDAIGYGTSNPEAATNYPTHIIYDSCTVDSGRGAMFCFEGSRYTKACNSISTNMRFCPVKLGSYVEPEGSYSCKGMHQSIDNCEFNMVNPIVSNTALKEIPIIWTAVNSQFVTPGNKASDIQVSNCIFNAVNESTVYNTGGFYYITHVDNATINGCIFNGRPIKIVASSNITFKDNKAELGIQCEQIKDSRIINNDFTSDVAESWLEIYYDISNCVVDNDAYIIGSNNILFKYQASIFKLTSSDAQHSGNRIRGGDVDAGYEQVELIGIPYVNKSAFKPNMTTQHIVKDITDNKLYINKDNAWVAL